jgi:hypothetical protein
MLVIATDPLSIGAPDVKFEEGFALTAVFYCLLALWHAIVSIRRRFGSGALDSAVTRHDAASVR